MSKQQPSKKISAINAFGPSKSTKTPVDSSSNAVKTPNPSNTEFSTSTTEIPEFHQGILQKRIQEIQETSDNRRMSEEYVNKDTLDAKLELVSAQTDTKLEKVLSEMRLGFAGLQSDMRLGFQLSSNNMTWIKNVFFYALIPMGIATLVMLVGLFLTMKISNPPSQVIYIPPPPSQTSPPTPPTQSTPHH